MELATRAAYRGQLTKIVKAASDYLVSAESQLDDKADFDVIEEELTIYLQRLRAVNDSLATVNRKIVEKDLVKSEFEQEMIKTAEYEDSAITTLSRLENRLKRLKEKICPAPIVGAAEEEPHPKHVQSNVSLPKLNLKKFDGNMKDWLPFWEQFRLSVHENASLSGTEKFNYLESCLVGAAKKVIMGFAASENCYDAAISLLQEQYGDVERIIDNHMQQLVSLRPVHSSSDVHSLRNLYNCVTTCRRSLIALNVPPNQYDIMLRPILLRCLPAEIRTNYHRIKERNDEKREGDIEDGTTDLSSSVTSAHGHIHRIMEFLKTEIEAMERSKIASSSTQGHTKTSSISTAASLVTLNENDKCIFCLSSSHATKDCDSDMTLVQKRDILARNGRCFRCTKKGHSSKRCRSAKWIKCNKCKGNHITSMCDPKYQKSSTISVRNASAGYEMKEKTEAASSNLMCNTQSEYNNVFLKTARCIGEGQRETNDILLRTVIDGGSQNSYICESVAKKLKLAKIGEVKLTVVPFGSTSSPPQKTLSKVKIRLRSQYDSRSAVEIEALVVPQICVDLLDAPNGKCLSFVDFRLADKICIQNIIAEDGLSMLIGADYYWDVVTGKQIQLAKRLKAVETLFG